MKNINDLGFDNNFTFGALPQTSNHHLIRKFRHPWAVTFHLFFKVAAIFVYLFGSFFTKDFLHLFVIIIFLVSLDFWLVKNITGRLLVGLRWWNYIDNDGQSYWIFENRFLTENISDKQKTLNNKNSSNKNTSFETNSALPLNTESSREFSNESNASSDVTIFWIGIFVFTLFWLFSLFSAIFSFNIHWVILVGIALVLNGSNLFGYIRCRFGANYSNYSSAIGKYVGEKMLFNIVRNNLSTENFHASQL